MAHLAKGTDPDLKAMAAAEAEKIDDPAAQVALGDKWWALAAKQRDPTIGQSMQERGADWYLQALPNLTGLTQAKVNKHLEKLFGAAKIWEVTKNDKTGVALGGENVPVNELITVEFWFNTKEEDGSLLTKRQQDNDGSISFRLKTGTLHVIGDAPEHFKAGVVEKKVNDGAWHHVAVVKKGEKAVVYFDGKRTADFETRESFNSRSPWTLGAHPPWQLEGLDANFCLIRISKIARYTDDFKPEWNYGKDEATLLLK